MPFELENGTDYIGLEIADQLWLENDATSGGIKWPKCCCQAPTPDCGNCCWACECAIPKADLTLSWSGTQTGSGSIIIPWNGSAYQVPISTFSQTGFYICIIELICFNNTTLRIKAAAFSAADCTGSLTEEFPAQTSVSHNCNPFEFHFQNVWGVGGNSNGDWVLTGPTYGTITCCQMFHIEGCNSVSLPGATVSVYDTNGGTLLAQGITPANGIVSLLWSGSCNAYVTVTETRFTSYGQSLSLTQNGTTTLALSESSGYHCISTCPIPVADTLNATFSVAGAQTFTFSGTAWTSSFTASGHAYIASIGQNGARTITRDGTSCGTIGGGISGCPMSFAANMVPPSGDCLTEIGTATLTE